ncbi:hypothetical protein RM697_03835 [Ichthyenterobacterium sp. W332]|uniref:Uncharacterized protein n=1 Tax=Microcosmobacter mediterraneus TaxID=3075607 RepID=A0ABU2YHY2_9FLAO|nr:hypothetical protein [Ichthyenterobacterium sp. W332]MDT0557761.1 hypothetical protein [Ichthyenterobacterium sp. W332]
MKPLKFIIILLVFFNFSCDEIEELLEEDIEVSISFQGLLEVESETLLNPEDQVEFNSEAATYNILQDPEIAELLESGSGTGEIKKIEITQIRYLFQNFEGNSDAVATGVFQLLDPSMFIQGFETVQTNLASADQNNSLYTIDGDFTEINERLTDSGSLIILFAGTASDNPVYFDVDVTVFVKVTITPPDL